jgi:hypothetical protein
MSNKKKPNKYTLCRDVTEDDVRPKSKIVCKFGLDCKLHYIKLGQVECLHCSKIYKYKVVSTSFNDDIYGIEIIYLEERLRVLVNILAMGCLI